MKVNVLFLLRGQLFEIAFHALTTKEDSLLLLPMAHQTYESITIPFELALTHIIPK